MFHYRTKCQGRKESQPSNNKITLINNITNNQLSVLKVPDETGVTFFLAILPAIAITGTIIPNGLSACQILSSDYKKQC